MSARLLIFSSIGLACLIPGQALAAPGDHLGDETTQVVPFLEAGVFHRTNAFLVEGPSGGGAEPVAGTAFVIRPGIGLRAKSSGIELNLDFDYEAKKYFQAEVTNLDRFNTIGLKGGLKYLPDGAKVGFRVSDDFSVSGYEAEDEAGVAESAYQQHLVNDLDAFIMVQPGGPLEVDAGFGVQIDQWNVPEEFKSDPSERDLDLGLTSGLTGPGLNSRIGYGPALDARWRFFPKTAVVLDVRHEWFRWRDNVVDAQGDGISTQDVGDFLAVPDGRATRVKAGLRGRVTSKLVVGAVAGYGQAIYNEDSVSEQAAELGLEETTELDPSQAGFAVDRKRFDEGILLELDTEYEIAEAQTFVVGFRRDFQDVYFTNYVNYDRVNVGYNAIFARKVGLGVNSAYRFERYKGEVSRNDHMVLVGGEARYIATDYLDIKGGVNWVRRASADKLHAEIEYDDVRLTLGARFTY